MSHLVDHRIEVKYERMEEGCIKEYDADDDSHLIAFDDGAELWFKLDLERKRAHEMLADSLAKEQVMRLAEDADVSSSSPGRKRASPSPAAAAAKSRKQPPTGNGGDDKAEPAVPARECAGRMMRARKPVDYSKILEASSDFSDDDLSGDDGERPKAKAAPVARKRAKAAGGRGGGGGGKRKTPAGSDEEDSVFSEDAAESDDDESYSSDDDGARKKKPKGKGKARASGAGGVPDLETALGTASGQRDSGCRFHPNVFVCVPFSHPGAGPAPSDMGSRQNQDPVSLCHQVHCTSSPVSLWPLSSLARPALLPSSCLPSIQLSTHRWYRQPPPHQLIGGVEATVVPAGAAGAGGRGGHGCCGELR